MVEMKKVKITLPDGSVQEWAAGTTPQQVAEKIGQRLAKDALAALVNGKAVDLNYKINETAELRILTFDSPEGKGVYWHDSAHILASAVKMLWPKIKLAIGPAIEQGFYYDFDGHSFTDEELGKIEAEMGKIIKGNLAFERKEISTTEAKKLFKDQPYKLELVKEIKGPISVYWLGKGFVDLCEGPHSPSSGKVGAVKLLKLSAAYWRGDSSKSQLQRVYGISFRTQKELDGFLKMKEEAAARDHKVLGVALDLFTFSDLVGAGLPLWTPKGTVLRNLLDDFVWELRKKRGYEKVEIPHITKKELYDISGHWDKFKDDLFKIKTRDGHIFAIKPMNCPHHVQIYKRRQWSYRDLPQRYANTTVCYRDEQTGELSGLSRVRGFAQDDAHLFCRMSQAKDEFIKIWDIVHEFYAAFGFKLRIRLSLHDPKQPEKWLGDNKKWLFAENILREIAREKKADYFEAIGEAAFYGPKLDFLAKDSLGREWQVATIQLDMNMPERFDLTCVNEKSEHERIVMVHAAIMGSIERFLSIIIEHYAGAFPLWLSPMQVRILNVSDKHTGFAKNIEGGLAQAGIRVDSDYSNNTVEYKVRDSQMQKIPYTVTIGDKEVEKGTLAVRGRDGKVRFGVAPEEFIRQLKQEVQDRK